MPKAIGSAQLKRLQTLYSKFAKHGMDTATRADRIRWASEFTGRPIESFRQLTSEEALLMTNALQSAVGQAETVHRSSRTSGRRAGLDGRHDGKEFAKAPQLVGAEDLAAIEGLYARLGWTRDRFDAWLRSPRSPLARKADPQILTTADANRVRWALKGMLKHAGIWEKRNAG